MCDLENCSLGTKYLVYAEGKRLFAAMVCKEHLTKAIEAVRSQNNSDTKIITEPVN